MICKRKWKLLGLWRYSWEVLRVSLLTAFLVVTVPMTFVRVMPNGTNSALNLQQLTQEAGGFWQLIQTIEEPGDSHFNASYHGELCSSHTVNWSNGIVSDTVDWPKTTSPDKYSYCENTRSMSFSGSATWTPPPQVIHPGDEINLNGHVTIHERDTVWPAGVSWAVGYNKTHVCTVNPREGTAYCENQTFLVQAGNPQVGELAIGVTVSVTWGKISPGGAGMNSIGRYTYIYEWVPAEEIPVEPSPTTGPIATEAPEVSVTIAGDVHVASPSPIQGGRLGAFSDDLPLIYAKVYLLHNGQVLDQTVSGSGGSFSFKEINVREDLAVKVELMHVTPPSGSPSYFQVVYDQQSDPISFSTKPFTVEEGEKDQVYVKILVDYLHDLDYSPTQLKKHELVDAALTYYYLYNSWDMATMYLKQTLDMPFVVRIFSSETGSFWNGPHKSHDRTDDPDAYISFDPTTSSYLFYDLSGLMIHEFGHQLMADTFDNYMPWDRSSNNHGGFANSTTVDSWMEGFANFFVAWVQRDILAMANPQIILMVSEGKQFVINLEANKLAWSQGSEEEFAVAALLWDLIDEKNEEDCTLLPVFGYANQSSIQPVENQKYTEYCDHVQLSSVQLWAILSGTAANFQPSNSPISPDNYDNIFDVYDLYRNLKANYSLYAGENEAVTLTPNGLDPIDELFIAHGFFEDINPQNLAYDPGEVIGKTSNKALTIGYDGANQHFPDRPERRSPAPPPESYIGYQLYDISSGTNIPEEVGDFFLVEVIYDAPFELYNYSFTTRASTAGKLFYYGPSQHYAATIRVSAIGPEIEPVDALEFTNEFYWQEGFGGAEEIFIEHTFSIKRASSRPSNWFTPVVPSTANLGGGGCLMMAILSVIVVLIIMLVRKK